MAKRYYEYKITVEFSKSNQSCKVGAIKSNYLSGKANEDEFIFYSKSFVLLASRSTIYDDNTILLNNNNSVNNQLFKGLLFYYSLVKSFPKIKKISIIRKRTKLADYTYTIDYSKIIQPIIVNNINNPFSFDKNVIKELFNESDRGNAYRVALSYWLKGIASSERYYKFERFWRAFNCLYAYEAQGKTDFEAMRNMRTYIANKSNLFSKTIEIIKSYEDEDLRKFRWRHLILNDYPNQNKMEAYKEFVKRYSDSRIMKLFKDIIVYREDMLKNAGFYDDVLSHIKKNEHVKKDIELVTILSIKYAYFVRNKMFHGEMPDATFKIYDNYIDEEIDMLNEILATLIFEIINTNGLR
jgi:hypothetical protein